MAHLSVRTKNEADISRKPRVYFTAHPRDYDSFFDGICRDLLSSCDVAIYYTENMSEPLDGECLEVDLQKMNLLVVPITLRLLTDGCRAMEVDIPFAAEKGIPILPIMMEDGIDEVYSRPDRFGERQYIKRGNKDESEIAYEKKLADLLSSVLIDSELEARVRAEFSSYVFLSYRKRDRAYANRLMRSLHADGRLYDTAIWYDEFLTPGESFRENISRALGASRALILLVTPSLLDDPNFVKDEEYPAARRAGLPVLPIEMIPTDRAALAAAFPELPECVGLDSGVESLAGLIGIGECESTPEHLYLMAIAYFYGIDVELDRERATDMLTSAAEAGHLGAMERLSVIYNNRADFENMLVWCERIYERVVAEHGEEHENSLSALNNLTIAAFKLGDYRRARALSEKSYTINRKIYPDGDTRLLPVLHNHAEILHSLGDYASAMRVAGECYKLHLSTLGEEHPDTLRSLGLLAVISTSIGDYGTAVKLARHSYALRRRLLGEEDVDTIIALGTLVNAEINAGNFRDAQRLAEIAYTTCVRVLGEEHQTTLSTLGRLGRACGALGDYKRELEIRERIYASRCSVLGKEHPDTLTAMSNLAVGYYGVGDYARAIPLFEENYSLSCRILGESHPDTLVTLNNLANLYSLTGNHEKAIECGQKAYEMHLSTLGAEHPTTLTALTSLGGAYNGAGDHKTAKRLFSEAYDLQSRILGEEHPETLATLSNLAGVVNSLGDPLGAARLLERAFAGRVKLLGEGHPIMINTLTMLSNYYFAAGEFGTAIKRLLRAHAATVSTEGETSAEAINILISIAMICLRGLGNVSEARRYFTAAYDACTTAYGADHPTSTQLAEIIRSLG